MKQIISNCYLTKKMIAEISLWEKKYPRNQKASIIIPGLHIIQQNNNGYLTMELMKSLANYLGLPFTIVYELATFYSMYNLEPVGKNIINICTNISCLLNGADDIVKFVEKKLSTPVGETSKDGKFTIKTVECQGACCGAPMLELNRVFYEKLDFDKVEKILDGIK